MCSLGLEMWEDEDRLLTRSWAKPPSGYMPGCVMSSYHSRVGALKCYSRTWFSAGPGVPAQDRDRVKNRCKNKIQKFSNSLRFKPKYKEKNLMVRKTVNRINIWNLNSFQINLILWKSYKELKLVFRMPKKTNESLTLTRNEWRHIEMKWEQGDTKRMN